jgi:hypothetical protein
MLRRAELQQQDAHERALRQIKESRRLTLQAGHCTAIAIITLQVREQLHSHVDRAVGVHHLPQDAVTTDESRPQRLMTGDDLRERRPEPLDFDCTRQAHRPGDVVVRHSLVQVLKEPHALLNRRRGEHVTVPRIRLRIEHIHCSTSSPHLNPVLDNPVLDAPSAAVQSPLAGRTRGRPAYPRLSLPAG